MPDIVNIILITITIIGIIGIAIILGLIIKNSTATTISNDSGGTVSTATSAAEKDANHKAEADALSNKKLADESQAAAAAANVAALNKLAEVEAALAAAERAKLLATSTADKAAAVAAAAAFSAAKEAAATAYAASYAAAIEASRSAAAAAAIAQEFEVARRRAEVGAVSAACTMQHVGNAYQSPSGDTKPYTSLEKANAETCFKECNADPKCQSASYWKFMFSAMCDLYNTPMNIMTHNQESLGVLMADKRCTKLI